MMFKVGDTLEVDPSHRYFYLMNTTFTYLGIKSLHAIRADSTGEEFDSLLTDTMNRYFKAIELNLENE